MKTKILAVLAVAILANVHTLIAQSSDNTTLRPLMWQSAVKPDAPPPSARQTVQATFAEPASKVSSIPLFYSAQRNVPPLPFNPFPDLQLFGIGENKFVYDDLTVDYFSLFAASALASESGGMSTMSMAPPCDPCNTNGSGGGGSSYSGLAYGYSSTQLWVMVTSTNTTNFLLDVNNTVSNTYYGVLAKSTVDTDPFNTWTLVNVFQATSTNKQLSGTASAETRFYAAVNLNAYVGPSVSIVSPAAETTVSNDVPLQIRVTDILPLSGIKVYVDGVQVGVLESNQNGTVTVPTTWFPNGQHQLWVAVANEGVAVDTDGDSVADDVSPFQGSTNVTLKFTNDVCLQNYSPLYSAAGSITFQYSAMNTQDYTFEVFKTNGTLLHTTNGQFSGSISRDWNFTDLSGNSVTDGVYVVSLTYSPPTGGSSAAAAARKIIVTNFFDSGVDVGKYVVSYGEWPNSSLNNGLVNMNAYVSALVNGAALFSDEIIGPNRDDYNTLESDGSSAPFPIRQNSQTSDLTALTNALKNPIVGSWLFDGHSGISDMIPGTDHYLTVRLYAKEVATLLGNDYGFRGSPYLAKYKRRLFSTFLTGCSAALPTSEWPDATGTPPGIQQVGNSQIKKSAFLGFTGFSEEGSAKFTWIKRIHLEWIDGNDYDTALNTAVGRANTAYPAVVAWGPKVIGYTPLEYNANDSR